MAPRNEDEYREWLEMLAQHRARGEAAPQGPPPPADDVDAIQAEADMLGYEAFMPGGAAQQPTLPAPDPYSFRKDTVYPAAKSMAEGIYSAGKDLPEDAQMWADLGNPIDMLARGTVAAPFEALQLMADPGRMASEQPLDAAGAAMDVVPGVGPAAGAAMGVAGMLPKAGKRLLGAMPTGFLDELAPIGGVTGRLQRRQMADVGSLQHAGRRYDWTPQPRGTYTDSIEEAVQKIGPEQFRVPGGGEQMVQNYANAIERGLDAGVPMDWFYLPAHEVVQRLASDPDMAARFAKVNAIMSANSTPVPMQYGFAVRSMEDAAAGVPIRVGKNPNAMGPRAEAVMEDPGSDLALKTDPFSHGIGASPEGLTTEGVNDFWEMLGVGYPKVPDAKGVPQNPNPTTGQHDLMHAVRAEAIAEVMARRGEDTFDPTRARHQAQEMHWADTRARVGDNPLPTPTPEGNLAGVTTMQERVPVHRAQHSWESAPGSEVQQVLEQFPEYQALSEMEKQALHQEIENVMLTEGGRDRLVDALSGGFALQEPAMRGTPGMYTPPGATSPEFNPGTQSRSQVGFKGGSMTPSSADRLRATEMVRATTLGQNAGVASHFNPAGIKAGQRNAMQIDMGRPATEEDLRSLYELGFGDIVPTENGAMVIAPFDLSPKDTAKWAREQLQREGEIADAVGGPASLQVGRSDIGGDAVSSTYVEPEWSEAFTPGGGAFASMLKVLDETGFRRHADSPETRALMGDLADTYEAQADVAGGADPRLIEALRAWSESGLAMVEDMVKKGIAPAALIPILLSLQEDAGADPELR